MGVALGDKLGIADGASDGAGVGAVVGDFVGAFVNVVGDRVGASVGAVACDGACVGADVDAAVVVAKHVPTEQYNGPFVPNDPKSSPQPSTPGVSGFTLPWQLSVTDLGIRNLFKQNRAPVQRAFRVSTSFVEPAGGQVAVIFLH